MTFKFSNRKRPLSYSRVLRPVLFFVVLLLQTVRIAYPADPPGILSHQGRIAVNGVNHDDTGYFKFSLVKDAGGTESILWHHDATALGTGEPAGEVTVTVTKGHYSVLLGESPMTAIPASAFIDNDDVSLRIWFSTLSGSGFELLAPDRRIASVGYALSAGTVQTIADGTISGAMLQDDAVTAAKLASGSLSLSLAGSNLTLSNGGGTISVNDADASATNEIQLLTLIGNTLSLSNGNAVDTSAVGPSYILSLAGSNLTLSNGGGTISINDGDASATNEIQSLTLIGNNLSLSNGNAVDTSAVGPWTVAAGVVSYGGSTVKANVLELPATTATTGIIRSGSDTLLHTYGTANFFAGINAGNRTMAGTFNTASGDSTLYSNTTGSRNTASGTNALHFNTTGASNTASGTNALYFNTEGISNTAHGRAALYFNRTGGFNTASGDQSLYSNATGSFNTASGNRALFSNTTGNNNIALGFWAGTNLTTGDHNIMIGNDGVAAEAATIRIGDSDQTRAFLAGVSGVTVTGGSTVLMDANGQMGTISSSRRYKEDIHGLAETEVGDRLQRLRPVTFRYKESSDGEKPIQFGLIAEEVAEVFPDLAVFNEDGQPETVKYHLLAPLLLNEVQKLQRAEKALRIENTELRRRLDKLESAIGRLVEDEADE